MFLVIIFVWMIVVKSRGCIGMVLIGLIRLCFVCGFEGDIFLFVWRGGRTILPWAGVYGTKMRSSFEMDMGDNSIKLVTNRTYL